MKRTIILIGLISTININAQLDAVNINYVDRTEITMLSAQYRNMIDDQRAERKVANYKVAIENRDRLYLGIKGISLHQNAKFKAKQIQKLIDKNEKLVNRCNSQRYYKKFREIELELDRLEFQIINNLK